MVVPGRIQTGQVAHIGDGVLLNTGSQASRSTTYIATRKVLGAKNRNHILLRLIQKNVATNIKTYTTSLMSFD